MTGVSQYSFSFVRRDETGKKTAIYYQFHTVERADYRVGVPKRGKFTLLLDNEHERTLLPTLLVAVSAKSDWQPFSFAYPLPAYGTVHFPILIQLSLPARGFNATPSSFLPKCKGKVMYFSSALSLYNGDNIPWREDYGHYLVCDEMDNRSLMPIDNHPDRRRF